MKKIKRKVPITVHMRATEFAQNRMTEERDFLPLWVGFEAGYNTALRKRVDEQRIEAAEHAAMLYKGEIARLNRVINSLRIPHVSLSTAMAVERERAEANRSYRREQAADAAIKDLER